MKKMMLGLTAAFCAAVTFGLESANIVGYTTKAAPKATFRLAAVPFEGTDGSLCINGLLTPGTTTVANEFDDAFLTTAPQVQVQKADGDYTTYYYINNAMYFAADGEVAMKPGWADGAGVLAIPEYYNETDPDLCYCMGPGLVTPGAAIWFKDPSSSADAALVSAGAVIAEDVSIECPAGFRLRANAFPMDLQLNDANQVTYSNLPDVANEFDDAFLKTAAQIQVQKADGDYTTYYYINNAMYFDENGEVAMKPGWVDGAGVLAIPEYYNETDPDLCYCMGPGVATAAYGFWAKGVSQTFTMNFKAPLN